MEARRGHPKMLELTNGLDLSAGALRARADAHKMGVFLQMLDNAEYWLSFDLHSFEPALATAPSPLRELGVAVALKFGEGLDGRLTTVDLKSAQSYLPRRIAPDLRPGVLDALVRLQTMVDVRDRRDDLIADGFSPYRPEPALSVHALRVMGAATILIDGQRDPAPTVKLPVGVPVSLSAVDDKNRPLGPPEIESDTHAPLLIRPHADAREVVFMVPGGYRLRVRGRAAGDKKVIAG